MQMNVMSTSHPAAMTAAHQRLPAVLSSIQPTELRNCKVYEPARSGAEMQKMAEVTIWTQPLNQPNDGRVSFDSHEYEAPQSGSLRLRWK